MNKKYIWFHILVVGWMIVIFCFSAQQGEGSSDLSKGVSYWLAECLNGLLRLGWNENKLFQVASVIGYPVRKLAHMTEFGILAVLLIWAANAYAILRKGKRRWLAALGVTFLYAISDEVHQLFVPNRYGCFTDVLIDTAGGAIALLLWAGFVAIKTKSNKI